MRVVQTLLICPDSEPNLRIELRDALYKSAALPLSELGEPEAVIETAFTLYERVVIAIILYRQLRSYFL